MTKITTTTAAIIISHKTFFDNFFDDILGFDYMII